MVERKVDTIVIHCSDSPNGRDFRAADIRRWHTDPKPAGRGWRVPGYHFVICVDGAIEELVHIDDDQYIQPAEIANGVRGYNDRSIHICMIGTDRFTRVQWEALTQLIEDLRDLHFQVKVVGHRDLDPHKTCPNFFVGAWLASPRSVLEKHLLEVPA